jgi:predicted O-linked N-acetylglucosamine transferase (SPINDLY family)
MQRDDASSIPPAIQARFQEAIRRFQAECFWSWDTSRPVATRDIAREVIRQLRLHGGKTGWRAAADLVQCL